MAHRSATARLQQTSGALLRTQSAALANPLWNLDYEQVRLSLEAIATNPEIVIARVYGEDGEIMAQAGDDVALQGDEFLFQQEIVFDAGTGPRRIGEIGFLVTQNDIRQQTRDRLLLAALIALAAVTMEVGAALFALRRIVGTPLERLLTAINAAKSDRSRARVGEAPPDEMGQVMSAFNQMLDQQEAYESELLVQTRMESELSIGRDMQLSMVPRDFGALTKGHPISLWATLEPAREVGGDFYDAFHVGGGKLCLVIGDVSDKGVPAALLMAVTKTMVKSIAAEGASASEVVATVNEELCRGDHRDMFVTLFVAILDLNSGALSYCNAGHNPPLRLHRNGQVCALPDRNGPVVGALPGLKYTQSDAQLTDGETLLLYTDGVTEASDSKDMLFGDTGLRNLLGSLAGQPVTDIVHSIVQAVEHHEGEADRTDDVTILAVEFHDAGVLHWRGTTHATLEEISRLGQDMASALGDDASAVATKAQLILDEIGSNVVNHAAKRSDTPVEIIVEVSGTTAELTLEISDTSPAFDPATAPEPDTSLSVEERVIGGLGLHVVRNISKTFSYARQVDRNIYYITVSA
ncbi:SpoIIE family protein phosphatase [Aliiroseovarius sp. KMU-50]|uniref:SpoIIE family protein phosphatase n=1 Tax=Aliiroseovarius salicola TaxID=3009082 RepID=A0ABT4W5H4_9RHOB|nr:SpoIIE family protein phosphatase [Aliiroseovarius sp. KMU-50]MDA5095756.1 SpoIIE family protein phosphatase [Aliiroseovarius sp. KMU-50]